MAGIAILGAGIFATEGTFYIVASSELTGLHDADFVTSSFTSARCE